MDSNSSTKPDGHFLLVEEAAALPGMNVADLRQAIARGVIPIRRDNVGAIRIHRNEIPADLSAAIAENHIDPILLSAVFEDELASLKSALAASDASRTQLETLLARQSDAIARSAAVLDARPAGAGELEQKLANTTRELDQSRNESQRLAALLQRTFNAIEQRENVVAAESQKLSGTAERAMQLLDRAVGDAEQSAAAVQHTQVAAHSSPATGSTNNQHLERELEQRDAVIDNQQQLMERLVTLKEQSVAADVPARPRKRSFWQRLFGGGKGI